MIKGVVQQVSSKKWNGKTFYSVKVAGDYYGTGMKRPRVDEGDTVRFDAEQNDKGYWQVDGDIEVLEKGEEVESTGAKANGNDKQGFYDRKEARERRNDTLREIGASRNTAIEWIKVLIGQEALKVPTKNAEREQFLNTLLDDYIAKFRGLEKAEEEVPQKAEPVKAKPVKVEEDANDEGWN